MLEIARVQPEGTAWRLDLHSGDFIVAVNGEEVNDVIDFQFLAGDEKIRITVRKRDGTEQELKVLKDPDDNLGLEFFPLTIKRCRNKCIFCFVDQMPAGCRKSLYVKDDDYRASFLYGNFVTLSALTQEDWDRIFRQRLSPLYVSVHSTDPELRAFLLGNKKTPPVMDSLKKLANGGIKMHAQVVLCPGINDGPHLARTVTDLASLFPNVLSIAVVPVGVTGFRKKLFEMRTFSSREARTVIEQLKPLMRRFKRQFGTSLIFPADEFYIKAKQPLPPSSFYEDFPQIENGVGMVAAFLKEAARTKIPSTIAPAAVTVITGVSFSGILDRVLDRLRAVKGITIKKVVLKNRFFGPSVTVTGLLTGRDIITALKGKRLGDMVLIPANVLREDDNVFLDGMTLEQVQEHLKTTVIKVDSFTDVVEILKARGRG